MTKKNKQQDAFKIIRKELKLYNLISVAIAANVAVSTLRFWMNGKYKPRYTTLVKVANVLGYKINVTAEKI